MTCDETLSLLHDGQTITELLTFALDSKFTDPHACSLKYFYKTKLLACSLPVVTNIVTKLSHACVLCVVSRQSDRITDRSNAANTIPTRGSCPLGGQFGVDDNKLLLTLLGVDF
ncbi:hypothetical protein PoB_002608300 [Plakobranchus ocellatus]|uniref:Uncharacterized protein n=1 Tax=Plakobranchus ocellatus TaxID=259542 RepID=A0AAV3ZYV4_9GAST|nr:hypothetical protein PoB_002608300 [Plakobranchus ocellatus]